MKNSHKLIPKQILIGMCLLAAACAPNSPKGEVRLKANGSAAVAAEAKTYDLTPKVDILVVIDYSTSMLIHQENLARNIDGFVHSFADNQLVDFHFGMVTIWDSVHFDHDVHGQTIRDHTGLGQLIPLKNPNYDAKDANSKQYLDGARYVTKRTPDYINVMKKTLLYGEQPGPAFEELFTPIMPAFSPALTQGDNKGFYRPDANLIIIIISDVDDGKVDISPDNLAQELFALKGGDRNKVSVVGVLSPSNDKACAKDNGAPDGPVRVERLISLTNGRELDLCAIDFGAQLAKIGRDLSVRIPQQVIKLPNVPDFNPEISSGISGTSLDGALIVMTGTDIMKKAVSPNFDDGWSYDPSAQSITIGPKTEITGPLNISFTPVHLYNVTNGRAQSQQ